MGDSPPLLIVMRVPPDPLFHGRFSAFTLKLIRDLAKIAIFRKSTDSTGLYRSETSIQFKGSIPSDFGTLYFPRTSSNRNNQSFHSKRDGKESYSATRSFFDMIEWWDISLGPLQSLVTHQRGQTEDLTGDFCLLYGLWASTLSCSSRCRNGLFAFHNVLWTEANGLITAMK